MRTFSFVHRAAALILLVSIAAPAATYSEFQPRSTGFWVTMFHPDYTPWSWLLFVAFTLALDFYYCGLSRLLRMRLKNELHLFFQETPAHPAIDSWALSTNFGPQAPEYPLMFLGTTLMFSSVAPFIITCILAIVSIASFSRFLASHWAYRMARQPFGRDWVPCSPPPDAPPHLKPALNQIFQAHWWRKGNEVRHILLPGLAFDQTLTTPDLRTRFQRQLLIAQQFNNAAQPTLAPPPTPQTQASNPGDLDPDALARLTGIGPLQAFQALARKPETGWANFEEFVRDARLSPVQAEHCRPLLVFPEPPKSKPHQPAPPPAESTSFAPTPNRNLDI